LIELIRILLETDRLDDFVHNWLETCQVTVLSHKRWWCYRK